MRVVEHLCLRFDREQKIHLKQNRSDIIAIPSLAGFPSKISIEETIQNKLYADLPDDADRSKPRRDKSDSQLNFDGKFQPAC